MARVFETREIEYSEGIRYEKDYIDNIISSCMYYDLCM